MKSRWWDKLSYFGTKFLEYEIKVGLVGVVSGRLIDEVSDSVKSSILKILTPVVANGPLNVSVSAIWYSL